MRYAHFAAGKLQPAPAKKHGGTSEASSTRTRPKNVKTTSEIPDMRQFENIAPLKSGIKHLAWL
jgi:hypothetical protein